MLGTRFDTSRLIQDGNIELAAAAMALEVARRNPTTGDAYQGILDKLQAHNAVNQKTTEVRALEQHNKLQRQYREIQTQKANAELLDQAQIAGLEAE